MSRDSKTNKKVTSRKDRRAPRVSITLPRELMTTQEIIDGLERAIKSRGPLEQIMGGLPPNPFIGVAEETGPKDSVVPVMIGDAVNHPKHYNRGRIECIEFLEDQFMGRPHEWSAVKYLTRSDLKGREIEDLEKAIWYIRRKIELLKAQAGGAPLPRPNEMPQERA